MNKNPKSLSFFGHRDITLATATAKEITKINGDPYFVRFVLAFLGLTHVDKFDFMTENMSPAKQKWIKRHLQKDSPNTWKQDWEEVKKKKHIKMGKTLFTLAPLSQNPPYRPRKNKQWLAIHYLREYFKQLAGKPCLRLIDDIISDITGYFSSVSSKFYEKRKRIKLCPIDGSPVEMTLEDLLKFYETNKEIIKKALDTEIPLYENY